MCGLPDTVLVGRGAVRAFLGVGNSTLDKWHEAGVLVRHAVPGCSRGKYARAEVVALVEEICGEERGSRGQGGKGAGWQGSEQ